MWEVEGSWVVEKDRGWDGHLKLENSMVILWVVDYQSRKQGAVFPVCIYLDLVEVQTTTYNPAS